jgi:hypothetical protein
MGGGLESGQHHQAGGLARTRWPQHRQELALADGKVQVFDDQRLTIITFLNVIKDNECVAAGLRCHEAGSLIIWFLVPPGQSKRA